MHVEVKLALEIVAAELSKTAAHWVSESGGRGATGATN
jgi:hypothetical protein